MFWIGDRSERTLRSYWGAPAAAVLLDLVVLFQAGQYAVEIVAVYAHALGKLGNGDAGLLLDQRERLGGTSAAAAWRAATAGAHRGRGRARCASCAAAAGWPAGAAPSRGRAHAAVHAGERGGCQREMLKLLDERS